MKLYRIPNTDIDVSPLCLGTMLFGNPIGRKDAVSMIHWALDNGINFIDTADIYEGYDRQAGSAGGVAEEFIGKALKGCRGNAIVTSKVGNSIGNSEYQGRGLGRKHILHQIDASLHRLQTDYIDFYELHVADSDTSLDESIGVMAELIKLGKIRYWGFSNFNADEIARIIAICNKNQWPRPVIAQPSYSWLNQSAEAGYLPVCRDNKIAVTPYRSLESGLLTGKYHRENPLPDGSRASENPEWLTIEKDVFEQLETFECEARRAGLAPAQYAVRWLLDQPGVSSVVVGAKRINQLENLLGGCR